MQKYESCGQLTLKLWKKVDNLKTEKVEKNKHFKAHNFKVGQLIAVKNYLRNTFESRFISDYRVLEIVNECTLLVESPDSKTRQINIKDAKPVQLQLTMPYKTLNYQL